jgi:hypothetical protein
MEILRFCTPDPIKIAKSIRKIERYRQAITDRVIKDTIGRMRVFTMAYRVKVGKLKIKEFAIVDDNRLYSFGGYSDSD